MKVNKVSNWVYSIFMLLPILVPIITFIVMTFSRGTITENIELSTIGNYFEGVYDLPIFDWVVDTTFYSVFGRFIDVVSSSSMSHWFGCYFAYGITISLTYLGYEVLLAFINIARKLVYAFVDKEF